MASKMVDLPAPVGPVIENTPWRPNRAKSMANSPA
jgi:hypothetical protein